MMLKTKPKASGRAAAAPSETKNGVISNQITVPALKIAAQIKSFRIFWVFQRQRVAQWLVQPVVRLWADSPTG